MKKKMNAMFIKTKITVIALACIILGMLLFGNIHGEVRAEDSDSVVLDKTTYDYAIATFTGEANIKEVKDCLDNNTVPEVDGTDGYLFAGWFKNTDCAKSNAIRESSEVKADGTYYAKFMPEEVLSVKAQISTKASAEGKRNMRFVSSVESLVYNQVGFMLQYEENGQTVTKYNNSKDVFEEIQTATEGDEYKYSPKVVDTESEYFITATWTDISDFDLGFYVRAYWKTLDGVVVYGPSRYVCVNDGLTSTIVNLPVKDTNDTLEVYTEENQTTYNVTNNNDSKTATAKVIYHDGEYAHLRIELDSARTSLKSVTTFTVENLPANYRNLNTKYTKSGTQDTTWYNSADDEFVIATSADLYGLASLVNATDTVSFDNKTIYLVSNITVNDMTVEEMLTENSGAVKWTNIGSGTSKYFSGTFDGQGHTIKGLYNTSTRGFFGYATGECSIRNFSLKDSYFSSTSSIGSIAAEFDGTMESVYSNAKIVSSSPSVGGMIGRLPNSSKSSIEDCWFEGSIDVNYTGSNSNIYCGGIIGYIVDGTEHAVNHTLYTGNMTIGDTREGTSKSTHVGGLIGGIASNKGCEVADCLSAGEEPNITNTSVTKKIGVISGSANPATVAEGSYVYATATWADSDADIVTIPAETVNTHESYINMSELNYYTKSNPNGYWVVREDELPALKTFTDKWVDVAWYYDTVKSDAAGEVYNISTAEELYGLSVISQGYTFEGDTVNLTDDIIVNIGNATDWADDKKVDDLRDWTPIGMSSSYPFKGTLNGNGYMVSGIYCKSPSGVAGFIGRLVGGTLQNIQLTNSYVSRGGDHVGGVVGFFNGGTVESVCCDAIVNQTNADKVNVGGIIGYCAGTTNVTKCWFDGTVESQGIYVGGIVGYINSGSVRITDCLVTGNIQGNSTASEIHTGGVVGGCNKANWYLTRCLMGGQMNAADATQKAIAPLVGSPESASDDSASTRTRTITDSYATTAGYTALIGATSNVELTDSDFVESSKAENVPNLFVEGSTWTTDENGYAVLNF